MDKLSEQVVVHIKLMLALVMVMMVVVLQKNAIQIVNILEPVSATRRETARISNVSRRDWKEARIGPSPQAWQLLP